KEEEAGYRAGQSDRVSANGPCPTGQVDEEGLDLALPRPSDESRQAEKQHEPAPRRGVSEQQPEQRTGQRAVSRREKEPCHREEECDRPCHECAERRRLQ